MTAATSSLPRPISASFSSSKVDKSQAGISAPRARAISWRVVLVLQVDQHAGGCCVISVDHLATLHRQNGTGGCAAGQRLHEPCQVYAGPARKAERFGDQCDLTANDQVVDQLGSIAAAQRPHVRHMAAKQVSSGIIRVTAASLPPHMALSVPFSAPSTPPLTGSRSARRPAQRPAQRSVV